MNKIEPGQHYQTYLARIPALSATKITTEQQVSRDISQKYQNILHGNQSCCDKTASENDFSMHTTMNG